MFNDEWLRENGFLDDDWGLGTVADLLASRHAKVITAKASDRVRDVIAKMKARGISQLPVLSRGKLLGAVAEVDLLRHLAAGEHSLDTRVDALVESDYATVSPHTRVELLQTLLADTRMAIVLAGDDLVGVVTKIDLITHLARPTVRQRAPRRVRKRRSK